MFPSSLISMESDAPFAAERIKMLFDLIRTGDMMQVIIGLMASVFVVFCTMPIHEYAHALIATKLGDPTPERTGRLTLNPLAHIDPLGAAMILLVGFGYAKPVRVSARNFKNPKLGMALTALAGPTSNLIMALIFLLLRNGAVFAMMNSPQIVWQVSASFFDFAATINIGLAVFNFLPIPPLDGSKILSLIIPSKYYFKYLQYERYIILAVFALLVFNILDIPLSFLTNVVYRLLSKIAGLPFTFIGQ